ncbi:MAG TPA: peptidoglycan-binding domain-containing protein [Methylomirabilota bacterium]|nr:peptidoglycan-binding domain-containing protein [Methylomirabilota bacterium]
MVYRRGSKGPEVTRIQAQLRARGLYLGPADGDFGGGTESAVLAFQRAEGLVPDGLVGPETWSRLFGGGEIPAPAITKEALDYRSLALTGAFETDAAVPECFAGLSGNFDGQGISFGALQWNLGQGSLQPLLRQMDTQHPAIVEEVFGPSTAELRAMLSAPLAEQLTWATSIQDPRRSVVNEPWRGRFKTLGRREEFQLIQTAAAHAMYQEALTWCGAYGVASERAVALLFDIRVQNGSISALTRTQIQQDFTRIPGTADPEAAEVARLRAIANRRAEAASPRWIEDVRARKLTIAEGIGTVHGLHFDLAGQYGIGLRRAAGL